MATSRRVHVTPSLSQRLPARAPDDMGGARRPLPQDGADATPAGDPRTSRAIFRAKCAGGMAAAVTHECRPAVTA